MNDCCRAKRAPGGLKCSFFELAEILKRCWYIFVQNRRYWTELIDEIKAPYVISIN